jgi:hypothetical protein
MHCTTSVLIQQYHTWAAFTQDKAPADRIVEVHVFDAVGIGAGGSGAAAGLLHPFSPNGKASAQLASFMKTLTQWAQVCSRVR